MGRPKTDDIDERRFKVTVRFTEDEINMIRSASAQTGISVSAYIREQIIKGKVVINLPSTKISSDKKSLLEEYHKIGNNLNQIAHRLNSGDLAYEQVVKDIKTCIGHLHELRQKTLKETL